MKQIFYGPTGYGKSHLILHNVHDLNKENLYYYNKWNWRTSVFEKKWGILIKKGIGKP